MNSKTEEIVLGIAVILLGIFVIAGGELLFNPGNVLFVATGLGFLLMYTTKRLNWALILGGYILCIGLFAAVSQATPQLALAIKIKSFLMRNMFLFTTGSIFLIQFYEKNKHGLLIPGCLIMGLCSKNLLGDIFQVSDGYVALFVYSLTFFIIYKCGKYFLGIWPKYVSLTLFIIATMRFLQD